MIIDKLSGSRVFFEITVTKEQFEHGLDHAFEVVNKDVEIKGFRKGKAPRGAFEAKYGVESLYEEAINHVLQDTYYRAVLDNEIEVVAQPQIDLDIQNVKRGEDDTLFALKNGLVKFTTKKVKLFTGKLVSRKFVSVEPKK